MKKTVSLLMTIFFLFILIGCSSDIDNSHSDTSNTLIYSNLIDTESKVLLESALKEANIQQGNIDTVMNLICDYNAHMTSFNEADKEYMEEADLFSLKKGFTTTEDKSINYGDYYFQMKKWYNGRDYDDAYCRTLAFLLMQDFIHIAEPLEEENWGISNEDDFLYGDYATLGNYKLIDLDSAEYPKYFTLFHPVFNVSKGENLGLKILNQWDSFGVSFDKGKVSLITIWSAIENGNDIAIEHSHTGVFIEAKEGLLFIEKTNPLAPYQLTEFTSIEQLKSYMINTLTDKFITYELPVPEMIVLKNNEIL